MNFKNNPAAAATTPRQLTELKYKRSRYNLLLVTIVSIVNLFYMVFSGRYFLFSAKMPSILVELTLVTAPEDVTVAFADLLVPIVVGVILTIPYLLCFFFSKKRPGWMVAALVFFVFDCIFLVTMYYLSDVIIDLLFHAWVLFYLVTGVINGYKLKKMPEDEPLPEFGEVVAEGEAVDSEAAEDETPAEGETELPAFDESLFEINEEKNDASKE